jgi:hypothetical protein
MPIVGFNFNKITVQKHSAVSGKIDINNNVSIKDVTESEFAVGSVKQKGLKFLFEFTSVYEPKIGEMTFNGEVLFLDTPKMQADIIKNWKKEKKVLKDVISEILNTMLTRCNIQALVLSRDVNLPPPIQLPRISKE